jgi:hypothetical protein
MLERFRDAWGITHGAGRLSARTGSAKARRGGAAVAQGRAAVAHDGCGQQGSAALLPFFLFYDIC